MSGNDIKIIGTPAESAYVKELRSILENDDLCPKEREELEHELLHDHGIGKDDLP